MRLAALLHKVSLRESTAMPARTCLEMATIDGAICLGLEDSIGSIEVGKRADTYFRILVPTEKEITSKGGQKKTVEKKVFPGYVMVEMILDDDSWSVVRNTPGVTGFGWPRFQASLFN